MRKFEQLRIMLAREVLALDYNNIMLGAVIQDFIENTYIPKINERLSRLRDEDVREREKLEKVLSLWKKELKSKEWNFKAIKKLKDTAAKFNITGDDHLQDAASTLVLNLYSGSDGKTWHDLVNFDPEDGPNKLMSFWIFAIGRRSVNYFRDLIRHDPTLLNRADSTTNDDGDTLDPFDKVQGNAPITEGEVDALIRQMRTHVMKFSYKGQKVKDDPVLVLLANEWLNAFDRKNDLSEVDFKRDVAPKVTSRFDIKYNTIMKRKWPVILNALADFFAREFSGNKNYFKKLLMASDERDIVSRVSEDFYIRNMKAWMIGPTMKLKEVMKNAYAKV